MKKILFIFSILFFFVSASDVDAVRYAPGVVGEVPTTTPLQPIPVGASPLLEGNVSHEGEVVATSSLVSTPHIEIGKEERGSLGKTFARAREVRNAIGLTLLVLCGIGVGIYFFVQKNKK